MSLLNIDIVNCPEIKPQPEKQAEVLWVTGDFGGRQYLPEGEFIFFLKETPSGIM
jgi:hypothetical protein